MTAQERAKELAMYFDMPEADALNHLTKGFGFHHERVSEDWRRVNPQTDEDILQWYRQTDAYIWELSAYHLDRGFNYMGMIAGVSEGLRAKGVHSVLCLGDGIGDLHIKLHEDGFSSTYHDMPNSRTADFATMRMAIRNCEFLFQFDEPKQALAQCEALFDAIVSLDFLEHVLAVEDWLRAIFTTLKPGGWFLGQNAFGIGSGPDGGMPMHLERNDRFEKDYGPLMLDIGFVQEGTSNWWRKPA